MTLFDRWLYDTPDKIYAPVLSSPLPDGIGSSFLNCLHKGLCVHTH